LTFGASFFVSCSSRNHNDRECRSLLSFCVVRERKDSPVQELREPPLRTAKPESSRSGLDGLLLDRVPIVWAIDAFPDQAELQLKTAAALQKIFPLNPIHPIYVLSEESFTERGFTGFLKPALKPMAFKAVLQLISQVRFLNFRKPRILIESSASRAACARKLLRYTKKIGAGVIALSSHGRHGFSRFFVSSFSNAVMDSTSLPLLFTGPNAERLHAKPKVIVYPTDFSPACEQASDSILELAHWMGAEIHLFHKIIHDLDPITQSGVNMLGGGWVSVEAYLQQEANDHEAEARSWIQRARARNVQTRFISENFREPISEAIVEYVSALDEPPALIAMVPQTGPLASAFLGSVTREVIRLSPCPVYIAPRAM
jgi:nucleotide-binding universal stress UspA family protein